MSFFALETWIPLPDKKVDHDDMIRRWFVYVEEHQKEMFQEWKSARYFKEVDRETGEHSGRYMMIFEYLDREGFLAYKERRKDWSGPYAEYKKVDPYQFFRLDTVTETFWESGEEPLGLAF
ncbi:uncharacterized protein METZ01_LOCUS206249 [marine metagenome]|uniref:NIPSNAP domain-containing protein n=1 Tax=marine metagenome TaxID=408172 RepID=A0A382ESN0_9ZZZZ